MENNCEVTKYKKSIQNDNLRKLGELCIQVVAKATTPNPEIEQKLTLFGTGSVTVRTTGNGVLASTAAELTTNPQTEKTITLNQYGVSLYFSNGTYNVFVSNKYKLTGISNNQSNSIPIFSLELSELKFLSALEKVLMGNSNSKGNISEINTDSLTNIVFSSCSLVKGDYKDIKNSRIRILQLPDTGTNGDIADLPKTVSYFRGNAYGTIEGFVASQIAQGRTTFIQDNVNVLELLNILSMVTFGGNNYTEAVNVIYKPEWTSTSKITVYANAVNKVYAKGATAEEISTWEGQGKTVIIIS